MKKRKVGITGGIGAGKTTVAGIFSQLGVPVFNADEEAKDLYLEESIREKVKALLGEEAYRGNRPDTRFISGKIFSDPGLRKKLETIIHPAVGRRYTEWHETQRAPYTLKEAAIMIETGSHRGLDYLILVTAPEEIRIKRIVKRDNLSPEEVHLRIRRQLSDEQKRRSAHYEVVNDQRHLLIPQVLRIHEDIIRQTDPRGG